MDWRNKVVLSCGNPPVRGHAWATCQYQGGCKKQIDEMKNMIFLLIAVIMTNFAFGQNGAYDAFIKKADSLYDIKDYKNSALAYSEAFKA